MKKEKLFGFDFDQKKIKICMAVADYHAKMEKKAISKASKIRDKQCKKLMKYLKETDIDPVIVNQVIGIFNKMPI